MSPTAPKNREPSFVDRLDPRAKFISLLVLAIQTFASASPAAIVTVVVILAIGIRSARIPLGFLVRRLTSVAFFVILIGSVQTFTVDGDVMFQILGMYATREGLNQGLLLSLRIVLLLIAATVFVRSTPINDIVDGIEATLRPIRKHLGAIPQVLTIALSFVPMFIQSAQQIKKAQIARGAEPDRNVARQLQFAFSAVIPLFAMSLRSSEHLAFAMESRCYHPHVVRSHYREPRFVKQDWLMTGFMITQLLISVVIFG